MKYIIQHRAHSDSKHSIIHKPEIDGSEIRLTSWGLDNLHNLPLFMESLNNFKQVYDLLNSTNNEDMIYLWIYDVYIGLYFLNMIHKYDIWCIYNQHVVHIIGEKQTCVHKKMIWTATISPIFCWKKNIGLIGSQQMLGGQLSRRKTAPHLASFKIGNPYIGYTNPTNWYINLTIGLMSLYEFIFYYMETIWAIGDYKSLWINVAILGLGFPDWITTF